MESFETLFCKIIISAGTCEQLCSEINKGNVYLSAPNFVLELFKHEIENGYKNIISNSKTKYMELLGVSLIPSHEMKVVLFHKDYPKYKQGWMKIEIDL